MKQRGSSKRRVLNNEQEISTMSFAYILISCYATRDCKISQVVWSVASPNTIWYSGTPY